MPYRLLCTATAAPNDYVELGTSSEALGYLGHMDMLARFFTNKDKTSQGDRRPVAVHRRRAVAVQGPRRGAVLAVGVLVGAGDAQAVRPRIR